MLLYISDVELDTNTFSQMVHLTFRSSWSWDISLSRLLGTGWRISFWRARIRSSSSRDCWSWSCWKYCNAYFKITVLIAQETTEHHTFHHKLKTFKSKNTIRQRVLNLFKLNWICKEQTYFFTNKIHTPGCKALHSFDAPLRDGPLCLWLENCRWCNRPFLMGKFSPEKYQSITTFPHLNWKRIQDLIFPFVGIRI